MVPRSPSLRTSRPALGRTSGSSLFRIRPTAGYGGRRPSLIAPSPPCRLGPVTPLAVSAASLRACLWAWVALSGLVYARASAAVVVLVLRRTALPVRRGTPRLCAPVCSPFVPGVAESVVPPGSSGAYLREYHPSSGPLLPSVRCGLTTPRLRPLAWSHPLLLTDAVTHRVTPSPLAWSSCSPWYVRF